VSGILALSDREALHATVESKRVFVLLKSDRFFLTSQKKSTIASVAAGAVPCFLIITTLCLKWAARRTPCGCGCDAEPDALVCWTSGSPSRPQLHGICCSSSVLQLVINSIVTVWEGANDSGQIHRIDLKYGTGQAAYVCMIINEARVIGIINSG
jgi:hypothetical protein